MPALAGPPAYSPAALTCFAAVATESPRAVDHCRSAAADGEPHALYLLAGMTGSPAQRLEWLQRAAEADYPPALVALGETLHDQARVFEAEKLYFRAAELDYGPGMQRVVDILLEEARASADFERIRLMRLAPARDGYGDAAYEVALMFRDGVGGEADLDAARHWMFEAATTGHVDAQYELAMALAHAEPGQSIRWLVKAARSGSAEAMYELAAAHTDGVITAQNFDEALYWVHEAIRAGHADADRLLAEIQWRRRHPGIRRSAFHLTPHGEDGAIDEVLPASASVPDPRMSTAIPRSAEPSTAAVPAPARAAASAAPGVDAGTRARTAPPTQAGESAYIVDWQIELNTEQQK